MIYMLDTADLKAIEHCNEYYPIAGVTTNPTIISKEKVDFFDHMKKIRAIIGDDKMLHVQIVQKKAEDIVKEARAIQAIIGGNIFIKLPICEESLKATKLLTKEGFKVTMTAIFTPAQALVAAMAGATFVAPYANRLDNILGDGCNVVAEICELFKAYNLDCKVLAASFKNCEQVHRCEMVGCHSVTVSAYILESLIKHPMTDDAVQGFEVDWAEQYGDKTILDMAEEIL